MRYYKKMTKSLLIFPWLVLLVQSCDDGWAPLGTSCYMVSPTNMDWFAAQQVGNAKRF